MNGFAGLIVGFVFYASIISVMTLLFLAVIHLRDTRREHRSTAFHESAHALMAMVTGIGFENAVMEKNTLNHGLTYLKAVPYQDGPEAALYSDDDKTRHMLLVMISGYVAEMVLAGQEHIPQRLIGIESSDMHRLDVLLDEHPHLYAETTKKDYLDGIIEQAKEILSQNSQLHRLMSAELHKSSSLTEPVALLLARKASLTLTSIEPSSALILQA